MEDEGDVRPARRGVKWREDEDVDLMLRAKNGVAMRDIARLHDRSEMGVKLRIMKNILRVVECSDERLEDLCLEYRVDIRDILEYEKERGCDG